ncbi:hypothetical protein MKW92_025532 [Papaver armeniacum]|nr:hypothetical protein MKW92_025532 [Papaver armeniacum]
MPGGELLYPSPQHQPATPPQQPHPTIITTATSELLEDETWVWSQIKAEARRDAESEPDLASSWWKKKTSSHEDVPGESMDHTSFISEWSHFIV